MLTHYYYQLRSKISAFPLQWGLVLAIPLLLFSLPSAQVSAHGHIQTGQVRHDLSLQADIGYEITFKTNYWVPVTIHIINHGAAFQGKLALKAFAGSPRTNHISALSPWSFMQSVTIAARSQQQIIMNAPFYLSNLTPLGFIATLFDEYGRAVATQTTGMSYAVRPGNLFIGLLSDNSAGFDVLSNVDLPNQSDSLTSSTLDASTFPDNSTLLNNFDIIVLDNFNSSTLSRMQFLTLQTWINQGGILIEMGGAHWQRTLRPLPSSLLPIQITTLQTLPAGTNLLPADSSLIATDDGTPLTTNTLSTSLSASTGTLSTANTPYESQVLLTTGTTPLIVQKQQGQGTICYVAFDLAQNPLTNWTGTGTLWTTLLLHVLGDKTLVATGSSVNYLNDPGQMLTQGGIVRMLLPGHLLEPVLVLTLLLSYVLMLGPIRLLIVRRLKQPRQWAWHIALITILVFSLLSYSIAAYQRNAQLTDTTISLIQLTEGGSAAHILTYHGLVIPEQGPVTLQIANKSTILPLSSPQQAKTPLPGPQNDPQASMTIDQKQTTLTLPTNQRWEYHPLLSERDAQLSGTLTPHLAIHQNRLSGTITNTLATALSDVYILFPNYFVKVGHIEADETQQIDLPLHNAPLNKQTLADALDKEGGLTTPYFPYSKNGQAQTPFEQHMALLSALNGAGMSIVPCSGSCNLNTLKDQNVITLGSAPINDNKANTSYDPLLLSGAPATLIGWTDQQIDDTDAITINGTHPSGKHESFLQMPVSLPTNNLADTPAGFIIGNTVDLPHSEAQFLLPGIYSLSSASLLFEFMLPRTTQTHMDNLNIKIPVQWQQLSGQIMTDSSIQTNLFNWHTGSWDVITERRGIVTIPNPTPYTNSSKQLLLEITNPDNTAGPLIFGKPSLFTARDLSNGNGSEHG